MKKLSIIIFLIFSVSCYSQSKSEIWYTGGEVYIILQDAKTNKTLSKAPYAKVRNVIYDTFFKSFVFLLTDEKGATGFSLKYVKMDESLNETIMVDTTEDFWHVSNSIEASGKLWLMKDKAVNGVLTTLAFENVNK